MSALEPARQSGSIAVPSLHRTQFANTTVSAREQSDILLYVIGFFLPPLAVFLKTGCGADFLINILLTILAWLPGVIRECIARRPRLALTTRRG